MNTELNKIKEIIKNLEFEDRKIHLKIRYCEIMNFNKLLDDLRIAQHYINCKMTEVYNQRSNLDLKYITIRGLIDWIEEQDKEIVLNTLSEIK